MRLRIAVLLLALATTIAAYRLPNAVVPISYNLHLNFTEALFTAESDEYVGYVNITIRCQTQTNQVHIHAAHDFVNITLAHINSTEISSISVDNDTDIVTLNIGQDLVANTQYTLYIEFTSRVSTEDMYGPYKSSYTYNNETKFLVTTQFQPVYARRAFPCFDEPALKATFEIFITKPGGMNALSNMPGEFVNTTDIVGDDPNLNTTYFASSGVMPSYLVAFIVSEFTCTNGVNIETDEVPYRICSRDETNLTRAYAEDIGPPLLRSLNTYTSRNYGSMGFPKMDQVGIPDFAAGAMENWGLVTYREQYLLWDPEESTNMDQQNIATIISHEFAHMWFGNLVTLQWWSEMFLNEGFATFFEYFTTHDVLPEWELDKQWVVRVFQRVLESDALESSQPLQSDANSDAQVMSRFSQVSYLKGGSIFRMGQHILGLNNFRTGLQTYITTYAYQNTLPEQLWAVLDAQLAGTDRERLPDNTTLGQVMENWVINPGYPIIEVTLANTAVTIIQGGRFLLNGNTTASTWYVPISYATNLNPNFDNTTTQEWLEPVGSIEIPFLNNPQGWIILNNHVTGYYRVNYNNLWDNVAVALQAEGHSAIPEVNRAAIVDDAFQLARSNHINYTRLFSIIEFLRNDTSHHAWFPAVNGFNFLLRRVGQDSALGRAIATHQLSLLSNIYSTVPWVTLNDSNHAYTLKQVDILSVACRLGLDNCVYHALERFREFRISGVRPSKNLRSIVYCNALRYSNSTQDWTILWDSYHTTELASEKVRILQALGCTQNQNDLETYLQLSLSEESGIRPQDALSVFTSVYSGSTIGIDIAFRFLQENYQVIEERYQSMNALSNMITGLAERFTRQSQIEELRQFIWNNTLHEDFYNAANAALATAEANSLWYNQSREELHLLFDLHDPAVTTLAPNSTVSTEAPSSTTPAGATAIATSVALIVLSVVAALC